MVAAYDDRFDVPVSPKKYLLFDDLINVKGTFESENH
jgi:hypothetical protein